MSTYIDDSEISIFNNRQDNEWQVISNDLYSVISKAIEISKLTNGTFDITVGPLMDLWGFSQTNHDDWQSPSEAKVGQIHDFVGIELINISEEKISKSDSRTKIDLNAIAKGFGVDIVFEFLNKLGYTNLLVEVGGEIRCCGYNQNGDYWRVGIDKPIFDMIPGYDLHEMIELDNSALATSGDYRNYFISKGKIYSHTIDPRTGYPIEDGIASASVTAPTCMLADALATALMVMGEDGLKIIEELDSVEALIVKRISENNFKSMKSSGWKEIN
jgi:thiamine biosynthesis lipoprotein